MHDQLRELIEGGHLHRALPGQLLLDAAQAPARRRRPDTARSRARGRPPPPRRGRGSSPPAPARPGPRCGSGPTAVPNTSARFDAGSVLTTSTRRPASASATATALATVVFPTPPLPVKNTNGVRHEPHSNAGSRGAAITSPRVPACRSSRPSGPPYVKVASARRRRLSESRPWAKRRPDSSKRAGSRSGALRWKLSPSGVPAVDLPPDQQPVRGERAEHLAPVGAQRAGRDRKQRELSHAATRARSPRLPAGVWACQATSARRSVSSEASAM